MESPPMAKKSSVTPSSATPSTPARTSASTRSRSSRGATNPSAATDPYTGAGNASRSSLPLGLKGKLSSTTIAAGTM
jgi:hypothetical protein